MTRRQWLTSDQLIDAAADLVSEHGENPEYDRALWELIYEATGQNVTPNVLRDVKRSDHLTAPPTATIHPIHPSAADRTQGGETMSAPTTFPTSQEVEVTEHLPVSFTVRPSRKNPDTIVVGITNGKDTKRVALVRVLDNGTVRLRTLDGNPREASSNAVTQQVIDLDVEDLTPDTP